MSDFDRNFKYAIARISHQNGAVVGAGFLISERCLLTCAHVVQQALPPFEQAKISQEVVHLDFPLIEAERGVKYTAKVIFFKPYRNGIANAGPGEDIAVLELEGKKPSLAEPVSLKFLENPWEQKFRIYGFPKSYNDGIWATGELRDNTGQGWLQMEKIKADDQPIEPGFSGAPIWIDGDIKAVIGMAIAAERKREGVTRAFLISTNFLRLPILIRLIEPLEKHLNSLQSVYKICRPQDWPNPIPETIVTLLADLEEMPLGNRDVPAIVEFVARILAQLKTELPQKTYQELERWGTQQTPKFSEILNTVIGQKNTLRICPHLLILLRSTLENNSYFVSGWFIPDRHQYDAKTGQGSHSLSCGQVEEQAFTLENIPHLIEKFWGEIDNYLIDSLESEPIQIDIFLPYNLFNESIENWETQDFGLPIPIGSEYHVCLRSSNRISPQYKKHKSQWLTNWTRLEQNTGCLSSTLLVSQNCDETTWKQLFNEINQCQPLVLNLTQPPTSPLVFGVIDKTGLPVALWLRKSLETVNCENEFKHLLPDKQDKIGELLNRVRKRRSDAFGCQQPEEHPGHHLSLLWEDPRIVPPSIQY